MSNDRTPQAISIASLAARWRTLLASPTADITRSDATNSPAWVQALQDTYGSKSPVQLLTIGPAPDVRGVFAYVRTANASPLPIRALQVATEIYSGRSSFVVEDNSAAACESMLRAILELPAWDTFQLTLIEGSPAHQMLHAAAASGVQVRCIGTIESPYVILGDSWDATFDSLPKKLRWTIRKGEKDLETAGQLTYEEHTSEATSAALFDSIYQIEKNSWKEAAQSSINSQQQQGEFYKSLVSHAARDGILSAHILKLDGTPLAYILGLAADDGVFLDLKESFDQSRSNFSPAHVLKKFAIPRLLERGVRIFDYMGVCESYKMRWTDKTYKRHTFVIYNRTLRGRALYFKASLGSKNVALPSPTPVASPTN